MKSAIISILSCALLASQVYAHSMMTIPRGRGNVEWWGTCASGFGCHGPCDSKRSLSPILNDPTYPVQTIRRGDALTISWQRFNHPGGFVRLAMVPFEESDDWAAFNAANAAKFSCYESNCGPDDPNDSYFGHMNGPGDGLCSTTFTVPQDLPDGKATLQWIWYGGGVYYGQPEAGFGEYYTCTDYVVQGGNDLVPRGSLGDQRVWQGGDASNPGTDVCKYWSSNRIGDCSFGDQRPPNPRDDDLLSQSLEPCSRTGEFIGRAAEFEAGGGSRHLKKRFGRGVRSDVYVNAHTTNATH
ncbi:hypothetical protein KI688_009218 [Linnemannia hyalina]|uniref:C3H1-type domain-containing protein n=1 Tax=Linnemannia hyalina TaxID=64524 RepID=A0A9P8BW45_9FUNG|nr:hypothetical protein KI688_009218 [Linnemannia hyalina]